MSITRQIETQCSHAVFMEILPKALGNKPYEISGNKVVVFDDGGKLVKITISEQPIKELGSLELPMESAEFKFENYTDDEVDSFMNTYRQHSMRCGGG